MPLAIFDLDNTLIAGDSDHLWGEFLVDRGLVDAERYRRENDRFYAEYRAGTLDIMEFLGFSLAPLARHEPTELERLRADYLAERIAPILLEKAHQLIARHRAAGDRLLIITATNRFITEPIAGLLGIDELIATEPEVLDGRYTGRVSGTPCYREGKIERLGEWLNGSGLDLGGSHFYSDSHNDLPLLERVDHPVAVDPDDRLREIAQQRGWPVLSLRT